MKLDPSALRYLSRDDFRVLTAVEMGQRNHEMVPTELIIQIADLRLGGSVKIMNTLLRHKLLHHEKKHFDGYRLTYLGYDFLALRTFLARNTLAGVGRQIGVGKESDIFVVIDEEENEMCLKMHRLGRTSFRAIKNKRDYHHNRGSPSWLYLSRLAATKEHVFMKVLHENGFPVPTPIDANRHGIIMNLIDGSPLNQVRELNDPETVYLELMELIIRFGTHGLIHGDFNEFNIMISDVGKITVIDFPQMVSIKHPNARMYFERDVNCIRRFFRKRFNYFHEMKAEFEYVVANREKDLDTEVSASGFTNALAAELESFMVSQTRTSDCSLDGSGEDSATDDEEEDVSDEDDVKDNDSLGDAPGAYLQHDYATQPLTAPRVDDIRRRVRRDVTRNVQKSKGKGKTSRNVIKNKEKRKVRAYMNE